MGIWNVMNWSIEHGNTRETNEYANTNSPWPRIQDTQPSIDTRPAITKESITSDYPRIIPLRIFGANWANTFECWPERMSTIWIKSLNRPFSWLRSWRMDWSLESWLREPICRKAIADPRSTCPWEWRRRNEGGHLEWAKRYLLKNLDVIRDNPRSRKKSSTHHCHVEKLWLDLIRRYPGMVSRNSSSSPLGPAIDKALLSARNPCLELVVRVPNWSRFLPRLNRTPGSFVPINVPWFRVNVIRRRIDKSNRTILEYWTDSCTRRWPNRSLAADLFCRRLERQRIVRVFVAEVPRRMLAGISCYYWELRRSEFPRWSPGRWVLEPEKERVLVSETLALETRETKRLTWILTNHWVISFTPASPSVTRHTTI